MMRTRNDLHDFQEKGAAFAKRKGPTALFLDMGLGKTVICLTALSDLFNDFEISRVLIVGPLRVVRNVWEREANKWSYLKHLTFSRILGSEQDRIAALRTPADIYLINYEQYRWLIEYIIGPPGRRKQKDGKPVPFPFDVIIFDELTKLKHVSSKRYKAHKRIVQQQGVRHWGLTGSPAARHLLDIFGQYYVLDGGRRLGTNFNKFRKEHFTQDDYQGYKWSIKKKARKKLIAKVSDITLRMAARDYIEMPDVIVNDIEIELPKNLRGKYDELKQMMYLELERGDVEAMTAASLSMKCHQFAQGAMYITDKESGKPTDIWEEVHRLKLEAFDDIIEEANGQPILGATNFRHDTARLQAVYNCPKFGSGTSEKEEEVLLDQWAKGELPLLLGYPGSMGHGLDGLQDSGHIIAFFSIGWNREYYDQMIARLARQGQKKPVMVHRIIMLGTVDEAIRESLEVKAVDQADMLEILKKYGK